MKKYKVTYTDENGDVKTGEVEALSESLAINAAQKAGLCHWSKVLTTELIND